MALHLLELPLPIQLYASHLKCGLYVKERIVSWEEEEEEVEEVNTRMDFGFLCTPSSLQPRNTRTIIAKAEILLQKRILLKIQGI